MAFLEATSVHTDPAASSLAAGAVREYIYDAATDLGEGQTPTNPTVELANARTRVAIEGGAEIDDPAIEGTNLFIRVGPLERGAVYELRIAFEHTNPRVPGETTIRVHEITGV